MRVYRLSRLAEADLRNIVHYTFATWGEEQADRYLNGLAECFGRIAQMPLLGRACDSIYPGFRRMEEGRHVIFYRPEEYGAFISRVLHQSMLPDEQIFTDR
ncbi:type II toxin-antitoxin system RelE/ParE family toxin [Paracidobacterium acidisoli]|uniref:Toxin n=1 Tax=Paracidobacterium acidisoli TaxID=2303751 RepID=A0A372ISC0_9BACT|nr:type II toxin-antitoxin system RelE/ParE family toxin [Paracidobacterium acidisoli]